METTILLPRWAWSLLASLAATIIALSVRPYRDLRAIEITMALVVGTSLATFVGSLVAFWVFGKGPVDIRILGTLFYIMAPGTRFLIPLAIKWMSRSFGQEPPR